MSGGDERTHPNRGAFPPGMSGPSLRALDHAGIRSMEELTRRTEKELAAMHGMGPKGIRMLREGLEATGLSFRVPE